MTTTNQQQAVQGKQPEKISPEELQAMIAQYQAGEVIASRLPFTFPSGFKLTEVVPQCKLCGSEIRKQDFRGSWNQVLPDVVVIDGHGVCRSCRCITAFLFRVRGKALWSWNRSAMKAFGSNTPRTRRCGRGSSASSDC